MEKSHAAQLNYMAAQCKRSVLNSVREVAGPAAGLLEINHRNHPCINSALEAATLVRFIPLVLFSSSCTHAFVASFKWSANPHPQHYVYHILKIVGKPS